MQSDAAAAIRAQVLAPLAEAEETADTCRALGAEVIVLLAGGSKRSQAADIRKAKALAKLLD